MSRSLQRGVLAAVMGLCLVAASPASAATEFGDSCAGSTAAPNYTLMTLSAPGQTVAAPVSGVITQVKINVAISIPFAIPTEVKVLHPVGGNVFMNTEQATVQAGPGLTTTNVRMPVQAGDHLGLIGQPFIFEGTPIESLSVYCAGSGIEGELGAAPGNLGKGSSAEFFHATTGRVPLAATIEPDADNDGYGDETQDKCPQLASTHEECPLVVLDSYAVPGKGKAVILIATDTAGAVAVSGSVKLPKASKGGKKAGASSAAKLTAVTQTVTPGNLGRFVLKFPASLKQALASLPKGKKLKLAITATETNAVGKVSQDSSTLVLKG